MNFLAMNAYAQNTAPTAADAQEFHVGLEAFGGARKARADECVRRYASKC